MQLIGNLKNRRRYWELEEETEDRKNWKRHDMNIRKKYKHRSVETSNRFRIPPLVSRYGEG